MISLIKAIDPSEISTFFTFFPVSNSDFVETFTECLFNIVIVII